LAGQHQDVDRAIVGGSSDGSGRPFTERESTKLCHMFGSRPGLKVHVRILGSLPLNKNPKLPFFSDG